MTRATANVFLTTTIVVIGLAASALGVAGVININAAHIMLIAAWIVCVAGVSTAEAFASKPMKQILMLAALTALVSGVVLYGVDKWIVSKKAKQEESVAQLPPLNTPQSSPVNVASDIARSRKQPASEIRKGGPILRRTKKGVVCANPPEKAILNYWPITFSSPAEFCHDYPVIDVRHSGDDGKYSQSMEDWQDGIVAHSGDELYVLVYVNNGAANAGVDLQTALARNVSVAIQTDPAAGNRHYIDVSATGDNVETVYGRFRINTNSNERLEVIPRSGEVRDSTGTRVLAEGFDLGNNAVKLGDLRPNFEDALFIRYRVRVIS